MGAGPVGAVIAERAASLRSWRSLIVEKRNHIAGNCYDSYHKSGVMIHDYGPHYFRTDDDEVVDYLSNFTEWIEGDYRVHSSVNNELYPFPINLDTLEKFFKMEGLDETSGKELLDKLKEQIPDPKNSEEFVLSRVGKELYEAFYLNYTIKQWEKHPSQLDPSVCGRIPVKLNRDPYYTNQKFRIFPKDGFTAMFNRMLDNPLIDIKLDTDYFDLRDQIKPTLATVYTGPIDRYFDFSEGKLEWRSLEFVFETHPEDFNQSSVQINYPNEHAYTRTVEIKHVTKQEHPNTVVCKEYPKNEGDPYYPVPNLENRERYLKYRSLAEGEENVHFVGRLAEYTYINTDQAIRKALDLFQRLDACHI